MFGSSVQEYWTHWDFDTCSILSSFYTSIKISTGTLTQVAPKKDIQYVHAQIAFWVLTHTCGRRGGFGSGIGQIRCPSVENKFTNNPSANCPLIGSGGWVGWAGLAGGWSGLMGLQVDFKNSVHIIVLDFFGLFGAILKPNQQLIRPTNLVFLAIFLLFLIC